MLYERLRSTYRETTMHNFFPAYLLDNFYKYVSQQNHRNRKYLSPYKFANENSIPVNDSIKFFLFLTGEDKPLDIVYFFECSSMLCGHRNFFTKDEFVDLNNISSSSFICEECEKPYEYHDIKSFIKVYFIVNNNYPEQSYDPNSTYSTLEEMMPYLKEMSPSSMTGNNTNKDEGDDIAVGLDVLSELNKTSTGTIISQSFEETMFYINGFIKK
ncbi:MAG: hypothetical protein ABF649_04015 [Bacillus sp. (in: firmicutes)]